MRNSLESWQLLSSAVGEMGHCNLPNSIICWVLEGGGKKVVFLFLDTISFDSANVIMNSGKSYVIQQPNFSLVHFTSSLFC